ncbi:DUF2478 domain-containing protein [Oceanibium sediminis]|uniref:DUF2478 domain-containing protein n=1 Tax=Oceanibium sediminis TaxID=2026339 RepID=UPI000DD332E8|nr:DUF2478 domain-containing protein [Oceanibium sediminis]
MNIAFTMAPGRGDTDLFLYALAQDLAARGYRTCGTVQKNTACDDRRCDMDIKILPDGPVLRISQSLGRDARGCRLDPSALETAVGLAAARLGEGADVLIVNKFGKHEVDGRGFRGVIAEALAMDIPVIVGLNSMNAEAFHTFTGGCAVQLKPDRKDILAWLEGLGSGSDVPQAAERG